jgi:hypothetical protein
LDVSISLKTDTLSEESRRAFRDGGTTLASAFGLAEEQIGLSPTKVRLVVADDFRDAVRENWGVTGDEPEFEPARLGGIVAAKNLPQDELYESVVIVFDAQACEVADDESGSKKLAHAFLLAHELTHPLLSRVRALSRVHAATDADGEISPRGIARVIADEYRADRFADLIISRLLRATVNGADKPATQWLLVGEPYTAWAASVLEQTYPQWPDLVDSYRLRRLSLVEMWDRLRSNLGQVLTTLTHVQALMDSHDDVNGEAPRDVLPSMVVSHRGADLYLLPCQRVFEVLRQQPLITAPDNAFALEGELLREADDVFRQVWASLGLKVSPQAGGVYIDVRAPRR